MNNFKPKHYTYSKSPGQVDECCICLEEFIEGDFIAILHCECKFKIHWICFEQHKEYRNDCPICHLSCTIVKKKTLVDSAVNIIRLFFSSE